MLTDWFMQLFGSRSSNLYVGIWCSFSMESMKTQPDDLSTTGPFGIILCCSELCERWLCSWPSRRELRNLATGVSEGPLSVLQHTFQHRSWLEFWITAFQLARREWGPSSKNPVCLGLLSSGCRARKSCFLTMPSLLSWGWLLCSVYFSGDFVLSF